MWNVAGAARQNVISFVLRRPRGRVSLCFVRSRYAGMKSMCMKKENKYRKTTLYRSGSGSSAQTTSCATSRCFSTFCRRRRWHKIATTTLMQKANATHLTTAAVAIWLYGTPGRAGGVPGTEGTGATGSGGRSGGGALGCKGGFGGGEAAEGDGEGGPTQLQLLLESACAWGGSRKAAPQHQRPSGESGSMGPDAATQGPSSTSETISALVVSERQC